MRLIYQKQSQYVFNYRLYNLDYPMHVDNAVEIFLCTAGSSIVQYGDDTYHIAAGDIFFCFPNQPHGYYQSDKVEGYILIVPVKPLLAPYHNTLMYQQPVCPVIHAPQWRTEELGVLIPMALRERDSASANVMHGYLLAIVGKVLDLFELKRSSSVTDDALRDIIIYLNAHYREHISRKQIAAAVGYNESYISHIFSQALKTTLPKYLNSLRIYDASRMLTETDVTVAQIASELGFGSIRSFNRVFLEELGMTPREYRMQERAGKSTC